MRYNPAKRESYDPFDMMDDFFDHPFRSFGGNTLMRTDVTETDQAYELAIDLPGYKKENIHISLKDGTLTVSADQDHDHEEKNSAGHVIRQERYSGSCSRSWYVGDDVRESDIRASYDGGVLKLSISKKVPEEPKESYITIE